MVLGTHSLGVHGDILVVDDEAAVVEVVALYLRRDGFDVRVAHDGLAAQKAIDEQLPALVVLDVMIPGLDGLALMRQLRADPGVDVPVILLTARSQEADRIYGLELGADDYVIKPFSPRELTARVCAVLALVGTVNIPIIYKSVDWWFTLHQPATLKMVEVQNYGVIRLRLAILGSTSLIMLSAWIWSPPANLWSACLLGLTG